MSDQAARMWPWRVIRRRLQAYIRAKVQAEFEVRRLDIERLRRNVEKLELALTEHPDFASGSFDAPASSSPSISVIMPTWNRAAILGAAIRSVQAQHFQNWELLVLDDGSMDNTADIVAPFVNNDPRISYVKLAHAGQCKARNHGHSIAKGALIAYLDSDNLWYPQYLSVAAAVFKQRPDVDIAYGALVSDHHGQRVLFEPFDRERLKVANFIDTSVFIHRSYLIDRFGGFDEKTTPLEDWDLVLRYTAHAPAYRLPVLAARYREMDDIRLSVTQEKRLPIQRVQDRWKSTG